MRDTNLETLFPNLETGEHIFSERQAGDTIRLAQDLGVLTAVHPALRIGEA